MPDLTLTLSRPKRVTEPIAIAIASLSSWTEPVASADVRWLPATE